MKLFTLLVFTTVSILANGQDFKPVKVGMGFGVPAGGGANGGGIGYLEPAYRLSDRIAVGLRLEVAVKDRITTVVLGSSGSSTSEAGLSGSGSFTLNGQYYFSNGAFRPFAGLGFGLFYQVYDESFLLAATGVDQFNSKIGFYPRVGFDVGHFSVNMEYNIIPKTTGRVEEETATGTDSLESTTKNSYMGFKLGWFFGGGKER